MNRKKIMICGASGSMGRQTAKTVLSAEDLELVGCIDVNNQGQDMGNILDGKPVGVLINSNIDEVIDSMKPQVMVDFTKGHIAPANILKCLERRIPCIVGTTGINDQDIKAIEELSIKQNTAVFIVPNFSMGAVLMMKFAQSASEYYDNVEIIELHHDRKADAPSGTAVRTADMMTGGGKIFRSPLDEVEKIQGARGGVHKSVHIHSIRLPGLLAHQQVIFGGAGETLTLRHDSLSRECFMPGVLLAIRRIDQIQGLTTGLENIL